MFGQVYNHHDFVLQNAMNGRQHARRARHIDVASASGTKDELVALPWIPWNSQSRVWKDGREASASLQAWVMVFGCLNRLRLPATWHVLPSVTCDVWPTVADWRQCCSKISRDLLASTHYPTLQAASSSLVWQPRPDNLTCGVSSVFCAMVSQYGLRLRIAMHSTVCMFFSSKSEQCQDFGLCSFSGDGCTHHSTSTMPKQEQLTHSPGQLFMLFAHFPLHCQVRKIQTKAVRHNT